jgi:hypothetical protein
MQFAGRSLRAGQQPGVVEQMPPELHFGRAHRVIGGHSRPRESYGQVSLPFGCGQSHRGGQYDGCSATNHTVSCAPVCDVS